GPVMISVTGPGAAAHLSRLALGLRVDQEELAGAEEGSWWAVGEVGGEGVVVARWQDVGPPSFDAIGPRAAVEALRSSLVAGGVAEMGLDTWETLRVEAGRPAFGVDMDQDTIPVEAGIDGRAIDHAKGCYTGQEVIVRIRDRGHVNRSLRNVFLGDVPLPAAGAELFVEGESRPMGRVTSAVLSPSAGGVLALAYVRRGVESGTALVLRP
ncbi:MAG: hypothetical protein OEZ37_05255, partial [Gemmatimonadota bacterium]|nr:hypothetical protein [Gemmatimonadota bacterium]